MTRSAPEGRSAATRDMTPEGRSAATRDMTSEGRSAATRDMTSACGGAAYWQQRADVVVVGTGVAGLVAALAVHRRGHRVIVLSKAAETATFYAQGGIAVVVPDTDDTIETHVADTLAAGGGLCDPEAVTSIVANGYAAVAELVNDGARFDESAPGQWALTREGGHSRRRIIHAGGDATGAEVQRALDRAAATLDIRRNHVALQLLHESGAVTGVLVRNEDGLGVVHAPSVILATGGLGHLYSATTNPEGSTGDGIALALWAGVGVSDVEFIQFHPTMLFDGNAGGRRPLITEAIRGEGAVLVDARGESVTAGVHPMGDLAPRDVVAAAIDARLTQTGDPCVYLDARSIPGFAARFPTVTAACLAAGIDPTRQLIPVVPGAHYSCGGVVTDVHGRTELSGLFAAGEVARTGMHGANRLASNSLLEGLVVGNRAGVAAAQHAVDAGPSRAVAGEAPVRRALPRAELQRAMSRDVSVVRDAEGLRRLEDLLAQATDRRLASRTDLEDVALTAAAGVVAAAALARTESRGCHHRSDYLDTDPDQARSVVSVASVASLAATC
ncbi:MAG: L-aspartate oxidase [Mycobacterium sp.]|nr:L-aspartate oxidase [Mycobacterium sp.]